MNLGRTILPEVSRYLSQDIYCGGYSGEDPPLPIPNREVKLAIADGTAPPGGRVGSCHALIKSFETSVSELFLCVAACPNPLGLRPRPLKGYFGPTGRSLRDLETAWCSTSTRNLLTTRRLNVTAGFGEVFEMMSSINLIHHEDQAYLG